MASQIRSSETAEPLFSLRISAICGTDVLPSQYFQTIAAVSFRQWASLVSVSKTKTSFGTSWTTSPLVRASGYCELFIISSKTNENSLDRQTVSDQLDSSKYSRILGAVSFA